jgi:hypothetical protein
MSNNNNPKQKQKRTPFIKDDSNLIKAISNETHVLWGSMPAEEEARYAYGITKNKDGKQFIKTSRTDYGRPIDIRIPYGYHAQVKKSWEMYSMDRMFRYMIDRCIDFGANGFEWEIPFQVPPKESLWDFLQTRQISKYVAKIERQKEVWNFWAANVNTRTSNILPGIDEINKWIFKQLLLGAMCPLEWQWKQVEINGETYELPMKMTNYNTLSTVLRKNVNVFGNEQIYIKLNPYQLKQTIQPHADITRQVSTYSQPKDNSPEWHKVNMFGLGNGNPKTEGFAIKYNWSPGDNTTLISGTAVTVGSGLYPIPPFLGLYETLMLRRALHAADLAILDGVINYIVDWEIGDATTDADGNLVNQPRPERKSAAGAVIEKSTIDLVKEMITESTRANVMQLFHPYYIKLNIKTPDVTSLISIEKYIHPTVEILNAFGIFLSPTDRRVNFTDINIANFEQMLDNIRRNHIKRFWETLCTEIVRRNPRKFNAVPNMIFNPLNTQDEGFREGLLELTRFGKLSGESLLQAFKKDNKTEVSRIAKELHSGEKAMMDENVPVSYVQRAQAARGNVSQTEITPLQQEGRPKKPKKKKRKEEED